jgi:hypothetical protein
VNSVQGIGLDGAGVLIGMWDGGRPDPTHPDLVGRITLGEPGLIAQPHPTHVAGTLLGSGATSVNQGGSSLRWRGVATAAEAVCYDPSGAALEVEDAILTYDIDLTTNSWVYPISESNGNCALYGDYASDAPEFDAIVNGVYGKRIPVVFAAGNERDDGDCGIAAGGGYRCIPPPGTAKNVITVGAHHSDVMHMTHFSSWGPTDDGRMKPDVSAPGCQQTGDFAITSTQGPGFYGPNCGTSMATPVVSGSVAILIEQWRAMFPGEPRPATSKALLGGFAKDRALVGPDYRFGLGAISLSKSVKELQTATTVEDAVHDLGVDTWNFFVPASAGTLTVTIAWDDPVAAELADTTLVNDLDLELVGPTSGTRLPFVLNPASPDTPATLGKNRLDNVEQVRVIAPEAGVWTARVIGFRVPDGPRLNRFNFWRRINSAGLQFQF